MGMGMAMRMGIDTAIRMAMKRMRGTRTAAGRILEPPHGMLL